MKTQYIVQYLGSEITTSDLEKEVKKLWTEQGKLIKDIKNLSLYVKVEENKCYFVINEEVTGSFLLSIFNKNLDVESEIAVTVEANHCPLCESDNIDDENKEECCCYECDTYFNSETGEIIREGSLC